MRKYGITPEEVRGWLFLAAPKGLKLAQIGDDGAPIVGVLDKLLRAAITTLKLDIVSLDPFVKTHRLQENSNDAMDFVCELLATIAIDLNCSIDLPHHISKGPATAGDANKGRGASSMKDAARLVYTLTPMTTDEATQFGLHEAERRSLVRMDSGKVNIAPPSAQATWFRIVGQLLDNSTQAYPFGDEVPTVEQWQPPDTWAGLDSRLLNHILDDIAAGMDNGQRYSAAGAARRRAAWAIVQKHNPAKTKQECQKIVNAWVKTGLLFDEDYYDPVDRKLRSGLRVNNTQRPS
jgi:hypothetical protein